MAGKREVKVVILGDSKDAQRAFRDVEKSSDGFGSKVGAVAAGVGRAMAGATLVMGAFGVKAVQAGSDLNETLSKSNTVFGQSAKAIENWAKGASSDFGQTKQQALEAAGNFGNMFVQLGIGTGQAAEMSQQMVELASDFASFHNADITEVLNAQQAAFRGEYDAVQRFVPTINAAAVEQEALAMGLAGTSKELTAQDKALAAQSLMMKGAGDAIGDFDRTNDSLANRLRIVKSRASDFAASIGTALLPKILDAMDFMGKWVPIITDKLAPAFKTAGDFLSGFGRTVSDIFATVKGLFDSNSATTGAWLGHMGSILTQLKDVFLTAFEAVRVIFDTWVAVISSLWERFGEHLLSHIRTAWDAIRQIIDGALSLIKGILDVFIGILTGDWSRAWEGIKGILTGVWDVMVGAVRLAIETVQAIIGATVALISAAWELAWHSIATWFSTWWDGVKLLVSGAIDAVKGFIEDTLGAISTKWNEVWTAVGTFLSDAWDNFKQTVSDGLTAAVEFFTGLPGRITGAIGNLGGALFSFVKAAWKRWDAAVDEAIQVTFNFLKELPGRLVEGIGDLGAALYQKGKDLITGLGRGIVDAAKGIPGMIGGAVSSGVSGILDAVNPLGDGPGKGFGKGTTLRRVQQALMPGTYVTSTYRTPAQNARVGGSPTSFHLDRSNPAVDIGGPTSVLDRLAGRLRAMGGWREFLWRVKGHFDHIHVAHEGGHVTPSGIAPLRSDELLTKLQVGETVLPKGFGGEAFRLLSTLREMARQITDAIFVAGERLHRLIAERTTRQLDQGERLFSVTSEKFAALSESLGKFTPPPSTLPSSGGSSAPVAKPSGVRLDKNFLFFGPDDRNGVMLPWEFSPQEADALTAGGTRSKSQVQALVARMRVAMQAGSVFGSVGSGFGVNTPEVGQRVFADAADAIDFVTGAQNLRQLSQRLDVPVGPVTIESGAVQVTVMGNGDRADLKAAVDEALDELVTKLRAA